MDWGREEVKELDKMFNINEETKNACTVSISTEENNKVTNERNGDLSRIWLLMRNLETWQPSDNHSPWTPGQNQNTSTNSNFIPTSDNTQSSSRTALRSQFKELVLKSLNNIQMNQSSQQKTKTWKVNHFDSIVTSIISTILVS